jgi:hypothetical protein
MSSIGIKYSWKKRAKLFCQSLQKKLSNKKIKGRGKAKARAKMSMLKLERLMLSFSILKKLSYFKKWQMSGNSCVMP